jgi:hypothetical protein
VKAGDVVGSEEVQGSSDIRKHLYQQGGIDNVSSAEETESGQDNKATQVTPHKGRKGILAGLHGSSRQGPNQL